jgi:hypothetical protein
LRNNAQVIRIFPFPIGDKALANRPNGKPDAVKIRCFDDLVLHLGVPILKRGWISHNLALVLYTAFEDIQFDAESVVRNDQFRQKSVLKGEISGLKSALVLRRVGPT